MTRGLVRAIIYGSLAVLVLTIVAVVRSPSTVMAASATVKTSSVSSRGGVTISPALQEIDVAANQPAVTYNFQITNNSDQSYEFGVSVVDFGSLDDTGGVLFIGNAQKSLSYRYALSPWVTLEKDRLVVDPHTTEKIPVTIVNKESLTPGGHYGALLVSPTEAAVNPDKKVQINQVISSLLFVKKLGGEVYGLQLKNFSVRTHFFALPRSFDLRFQNSGNVHVIPRGLATLTDPRGRVVRRGTINADSGLVLPESFRHLTVPLDSITSAWMPGRYTLSVTYRYDDTTTNKTITTSFIYLNLGFILVVAAVLLALIVVISSRKLRAVCLTAAKRLLHSLSSLSHRK